MRNKPIKYLLILIFCFFLKSGIYPAQALALESVPQEILAKKISSDLIIKINDNSYKLTATDISKWVHEKIDLVISPDYLSEVENGNFCSYKNSLVCKISFSAKNQNHVKKASQISFDESLMEKYVTGLAKNFNKDPQDAKFKFENGKVAAFSLNSRGIKLDEEKSLKILADYFKSGAEEESLVLPYQELDPKIGIDSIDNMGITDLIGEGRSNFRGSPKNRIFNIKVAADRFDGVLIKPREEFSFVGTLGEVDGEHGYLPELVIKKDKTEPEFGGGICQVSTTAFRAAIYSGLEITARRNHAYPVSYYNPQGMDATVYVPRPDLKFKNDTLGYILIQTRIEGTELIFDFYGTSDGRKINVIGPKITERNPDGSMKAAFTQQVFDKDGNLAREDVFKSNYDSPSKYPHPGTTNDVLTQKPGSWSDNEWKQYKKTHGL
jgi:vancomycin resistance protein YoaR